MVPSSFLPPMKVRKQTLSVFFSLSILLQLVLFAACSSPEEAATEAEAAAESAGDTTENTTTSTDNTTSSTVSSQCKVVNSCSVDSGSWTVSGGTAFGVYDEFRYKYDHSVYTTGIDNSTGCLSNSTLVSSHLHPTGTKGMKSLKIISSDTTFAITYISKPTN